MSSRRPILTIFFDFLLVAVVFLLCQHIMSAPSGWFWYGSIFIWVFLGVVLQKLNFKRYRSARQAFWNILLLNTLTSIVLYFFARYLDLQLILNWKYVVLVSTLSILEMTIFLLYFTFSSQRKAYQVEEEELVSYHSEADDLRFNRTPVVVDDATIEAVFEAFRRDPVKDIQAWCLHHRPDFGIGVKFLCNTDPQVLENMTNGQNNVIIEVAKLNNIRYINKYFNKINELLPPGGVFIACCQTSLTRKQNILKKKLFPFNYFLYTFDFLWHRVMPKIKYLRTFYFNITQGKHRVFPHTEILGRLYSCGFEVCKEEVIHKLFYVAVRKTKAPYYDKQPTYGLFIRLKRIGKNGELISVFKFRTMHAYSEYLQPYIYQKNNLKEGGKFADDFRISSWGRFLRKFWLDELPMLVNIVKGEMKLVGVRPLSPHYFSLYTPEMQALRIKVKPGLLPPFYSGDKPQTIEEVQENERQYIEAYLKNPLRTDWKYFWKIVWNIVFKRKRSE